MFRPSAHLRRSQRPETRRGRAVAKESRCRKTQPGRVDTAAEPKSQIATMDPPTLSASTETRTPRLRKSSAKPIGVARTQKRAARRREFGRRLQRDLHETTRARPQQAKRSRRKRKGAATNHKNGTANAAFQPANSNRRSRKPATRRSRRRQGVAPSRISKGTTRHRGEPQDPIATRSPTHEKSPGKRKTAPPTNKSNAIHRRHERAGRQRSSSPAPKRRPVDPSPQATTSRGGNPKPRRPADHPR